MIEKDLSKLPDNIKSINTSDGYMLFAAGSQNELESRPSSQNNNNEQKPLDYDQIYSRYSQTEKAKKLYNLNARLCGNTDRLFDIDHTFANDERYTVSHSKGGSTTTKTYNKHALEKYMTPEEKKAFDKEQINLQNEKYFAAAANSGDASPSKNMKLYRLMKIASGNL